ncbi:TPA: hypothetical protein DIC38_02165 [Candidatus Nomurabacteria bacterium]|nr:MAG: hypothetical protein O210_OD1C00001G0297 [Parcubacteria bacterium RAAC4_OD1_1]HCY26462.1 hypothetical protein [Candidatus Nomurabacteria bacterium]
MEKKIESLPGIGLIISILSIITLLFIIIMNFDNKFTDFLSKNLIWIILILIIIILFMFFRKRNHAHGDDHKSPHGSHDEGHGEHDEHGDHGHHGNGFFKQIWEIILLGVIIIALLTVLFFIVYGAWTFFTKDSSKEKPKKEIVIYDKSSTKTYTLTKENSPIRIDIPVGYDYSYENKGTIKVQINELKTFIDDGNYRDLRNIKAKYIKFFFYEENVDILVKIFPKK